MESVPLNITGSATFGRYPKISIENTYNMIISDNWMVVSAGYQKVATLLSSGFGRGIYSSKIAGKLFVVISNRIFIVTIYSTNPDGTINLAFSQIGLVDSFFGDVFIDENDTDQIAICDQHKLYIYNHKTEIFTVPTLPDGVIPGYVTYQNGRFVIPNTADNTWYLSAPGDGTSWFWDANGNPVQGAIQTKPDTAVVTIRAPGRGNLLFVGGHNVVEFWTDVGSQIFPYQKSTSTNIDYGFVNAATVASLDNYLMWLGVNETSGPTIMYTTGGDVKQISTDGINFLMASLTHPEQSSAFFFKQDGHLLYQITFYSKEDNLTLVFDVNTQKFFTFTDEQMNYHIARRVVLFNNEYYFISFNDGALYHLSTNLTSYDYGDGKIEEIPRIRICKNIRKSDASRFVANSVTFTIEQGCQPGNVSNINPKERYRVDMSISKNGGESFGSYVPKYMHSIGNRANRMVWWGQGNANDLVSQFRFWGFDRFLASDGEVSTYQ